MVFPVLDDIAIELARRSRGTARNAVSNLAWYRDVVQSDGGVPTMELVQMAFEMKGVDRNGLTRTDREYIRRLVDAEEPVGAETLATSLGESVETIEQNVEPFLLREGYFQRTNRGRIATDKARQLFEEIKK